MTDAISPYKLSVRPVPIPITVITGFLGAGKTRFLNRVLAGDMLQDHQLKDTVVIINEVGETALDHSLVETLKGDMVLLSAGCVCCTVRGDLMNTLEDLLRRRDNKRMPAFTRVIVETTGLADPAPLLNAVLTHPYLRLRYFVNGLITLIDCVDGLTTLVEHPEAMRQVAMADHIMLSKADLNVLQRPDPALLPRIQHLNPFAKITDISPLYQAVGDDTLQTCMNMVTRLSPLHGDAQIADVREWLGVGGNIPEIQSYHNERISHHVLRHHKPISQRSFDMFLDLLRATNGAKLLRMKGIVVFDDDPDAPVLVHVVQHLVHPFKRLDAWSDDHQETCIVFVLDDLSPTYITQLWHAFIQ